MWNVYDIHKIFVLFSNYIFGYSLIYLINCNTLKIKIKRKISINNNGTYV